MIKLMKTLIFSLITVFLSACSNGDIKNLDKKFYFCKVDGKNRLYYDISGSGLVQVSELNFSSFGICGNYLVLQVADSSNSIYYKIKRNYDENFEPVLLGPIRDKPISCELILMN